MSCGSNNNNCKCHESPKCKLSLYDCDISFLKPLNICSLFGENENNICDTLEKTKKVRNSFFSAKTAIDNFVESCQQIQDVLHKDLSQNQLDRLKETYLSALNTLSASLYASLTVSHNGDNLYNAIFTKATDTNNQRAPRTTKLRLKSAGECNQVILMHLPGIAIIFNDITKELKIRSREVSTYDPELYFEDMAKDTVFKEYIIAPGIKYGMVDPSDNILDPSDNLVNMDIFLNIFLLDSPFKFKP